jgi:hypothetical protein
MVCVPKFIEWVKKLKRLNRAIDLGGVWWGA